MHFKIYGRVQGVCYRQTTQKVARNHRLTGWVRNLDDPTVVEAKVFGHPDDVDFIRAWFYEGPPLAKVDQVIETPISYETHQDFDILVR